MLWMSINEPSMAADKTNEGHRLNGAAIGDERSTCRLVVVNGATS